MGELAHRDRRGHVGKQRGRNPRRRRGGGADGQEGEGGGEGGIAGADAEPTSVNGEATASEALDFAADDGVIRRKEAPLDTDYDNMWNGEGTVGAGASEARVGQAPVAMAPAQGAAISGLAGPLGSSSRATMALAPSAVSLS